MKLAYLALIALPQAVATASGQAPSDLRMAQTSAQQFHADILKQHVTKDGAPSKVLSATKNAHVVPFASILRIAQWDTPRIFVCWEQPQAAHEDGRRWTREAVAATWEKYSGLRFIGWEGCTPQSAGIRIQVTDEGPKVKTLGRLLKGLSNGMVLNFTFEGWETSCKETKESCIKAIAVHEFGHAIGLTHEQNRPDAPGECRNQQFAGTAPDKSLTPYDPDSVMNYCSKTWLNDGFLTQCDIEAAQILYGNGMATPVRECKKWPEK